MLILVVGLVIYVKIRDTIYEKLSMNYLVIKKEKIHELTAKYGSLMIGKCFELASGEHPDVVYDTIPETEKDLKECFYYIFQDLITERHETKKIQSL